MEGCVLYTSHQDDYASPGHMAMHISCCRCDISQKNMPTSSPQLVSQSIVSIASVVFLQFLMLSSCGVKWFQIEIL